MHDVIETGPAWSAATPRLLQELAETLQRLRLGGPFYLLLWLLAGTASGLWEQARGPFLVGALVFLVLTVIRFRIHGVPAGSGQDAVSRRLDQIWMLLLTNAAAWGAASAWLLMVTPNEAARTVAAISSYAFATAFAHNFSMRMGRAYVAVALTYLPTLGAFIANDSLIELVAVSVLYLLYVSLALRRSHLEYLQRLDLEDELRRQRDLFEQQSRRDGLTGLANRRRFASAIEEGVVATLQDGDALVLMILDLDHFKAINDRHGHAAGDACLCGFAKQLQAAFNSPEDMVARIGGEEFAVLSRSTLVDGLQRADTFRAGLARMPQQLDNTTSLILAVSIGIAAFDPIRHADADAFYRDADAALYRAKALGRNRVCRSDITT
ncbi:MAG: GGDEF domain-containing protein [Thermomonas sp.]